MKITGETDCHLLMPQEPKRDGKMPTYPEARALVMGGMGERFAEPMVAVAVGPSDDVESPPRAVVYLTASNARALRDAITAAIGVIDARTVPDN